MTTTISISLCPTQMEINGDLLNEHAVLLRIRHLVLEHYPDANIVCLQVGYRQGDAWVSVESNGLAGEDDVDAAHREDAESEALDLAIMTEIDWCDPGLYAD